MKISEYRTLLEKAFRERLRTLGVGAPGVGKTQAAMEAAAALGADFIGLCSALEDPSSIRGYPSRGENGEATHCLFDGIAKAFKAKKETVLFFDDLGMASESTMRAIVRLIQFGEIDNRKLPEHVVIGAATNDIGHGAGVYGMIEPLKSRFHTIVNVETDVDDVVAFGLAHNWPPDLLAYLRNQPQALNDWKPTKSMKLDGACPRGWDYCAQWINKGIEDPEIIAGCVGAGRATQYLAFRAMIAELPDVDQCLMTPESAPVPENPSARYLVTMALAAKMTHQNFGQARKYLMRLPAMFQALGIRDALKGEEAKRQRKMLPQGYRPMSMSLDFTAWACSPEGKLVTGAGA